MNVGTKNILGGISAIVILFLMWYFSSLVIYTVIAAVIAMIGRPIVKFLDGIRIHKFRIPHAVNTALTLLILIGFIVTVASIFVPLIIDQAKVIGNINVNAIGADMHQRLLGIQHYLRLNGILRRNESLDAILVTKAKELVNFSTFGDMVGSIFSIASSLFVGVFSVIFISFFFLKDETLLTRIIMLAVPEEYEDKVSNILKETRKLLSRYFAGVVIQLCTMMTLEVTGLTLFGIPNALLIGTFGGMMNIMPYIGPIIGATAGILLGVSTVVSAGSYSDILPTAITIIGVFSVANLVDNFIIQPFVFSNRVKAHPLEIFFVVLMAGSLAGVPGMIVAIPTYTVLRVIAREFFDHFRVVHKLTKHM